MLEGSWSQLHRRHQGASSVVVGHRQTRFAFGCFAVAFAAITVSCTGHGNPPVAAAPTPTAAPATISTTTTGPIMAHVPAVDQLPADAAIVTLYNAGFLAGPGP